LRISLPILTCLVNVPKVLKIAVPVPLSQVFDYLPSPLWDMQQLKPGIRIEIPFGRQRKIGVLLEVAEESELDSTRLKEALTVLDAVPLLSASDLALMVWTSRYYHYPIGETIISALAIQLRKGHPAIADHERYLCLTEGGKGEFTVAEKRAPRQAQLLTLLRESPNGLPDHALSRLDWDWRGTADSLVRKGKAYWREEIAVGFSTAVDSSQSLPLLLNSDQEIAVNEVKSALRCYQTFLLEGVTGSGKTEVYLQLTQEVLARGEQVMILLPEINLTPQLESRFRKRFAVPIAVFHSGLAESERCRAWLRMQRGQASVLLGTRSAVFMPMKAPGLIVLDEEHDTSFKQQDGLRFSARDIAVMRAKLLKIPILLGSATPSLESLVNAREGRYRHLRLPIRAGGAVPPRFRLLDIRGQGLREGISPMLGKLIGETIARGEQVLLFINRRGFAPTLTCHACGWVSQCQHCDANLVIHAQDRRLRCHHCGDEQKISHHCPACRSDDLRPLGLGTERVEQALTEWFPEARIARIDRDSTRRKGELERLLEAVQEGQVDILVGTQMLAKGHHFPRVTLVGIADVDASLYSTDFRSSERTAQLIIQVAGRAGREQRPGQVILQTRHPDHPLLQVLIREGYTGFIRDAAKERQAAGLPPFAYQALWRAEAKDAETPFRFLEALSQLTQQYELPHLFVLGPAPAPLARKAGQHRSQLLFQAVKRSELHAAIDRLLRVIPELQETRRVRWSIDIDPVDLY
jgi:primosomal protein N' (replication factor Y)